MFRRTYLQKFHKKVSNYFIKDDHELLRNDCNPGDSYGSLSWDDGMALFLEHFPQSKPYKTIRWGKDLQIWIVEGRDFRELHFNNPEKTTTIWGQTQKDWFFKTFAESDATFRILISPTPVVGPDRANKNDHHANKNFKEEGDEIRKLLGSQKNAFVIFWVRRGQ